MRVPYVTQGQVRTPDQTLGYLRPAVPDFSGITQGLSQLAAGFKTSADKRQAQTDEINGYKAVGAFADFQSDADAKLIHAKRETALDDANVEERLNSQYDNYESEFLAKINEIDPTMLPKFQANAANVRAKYYADHADFGQKQRDTYYTTDINKAGNNAAIEVSERPLNLREQIELMAARIEASGLNVEQKRVARLENAKKLATIAYGKRAAQQLTYAAELRTVIIEASKELGISPEDFATLISFETSGTFSTSVRGGAGNLHIGIIQFGPQEQIDFGAKQGQTPREQMAAAMRYFKARKYVPGSGILELYSTINAGRPGRPNATDRRKGGTPGTVLDKVNNQMAGHRKNAQAFLGGTFKVEDTLDQDPDFANVSYEDRVSLRKDAQVAVTKTLNEQGQQAKEHYDTFVDSIKTRVYDGELGRRELEDMLHKNELEFKDFNAGLKIYNKRVEDGKDVAAGLLKLTEGTPWTADSTDDVRIADSLYNKSLQDNLRKGDSEAEDTLINFAGQTGVIPSKGIDALSAVASGPDKQKKLRALEVLTNLEDVANYGYNKQVPDALRQTVDRYNILKDVLSEEDLLGAISPGYTQQERQVKDQLEKEFSTIMKDPINSQYQSFQNLLNSFDEGIWSDTPVDPNYGPAVMGLHSQFYALMKYNWVKTNGNMDATMALSTKQVKRIWGNTSVGGKTKLMAFPIEKFVPQLDGSHAWVDDQIKSEFKIPPGMKFEAVSDIHTKPAIAHPKVAVEAKTNEMKTNIKDQPISYKIAFEKDGVWGFFPGRYVPQVTKRMKDEEAGRFKIKEDVNKLQELYTQHMNANELYALKDIPVPQQLLDDIIELEGNISKNIKSQKKVERQGPQRPKIVIVGPGLVGQETPEAERAANNKKVTDFLKSLLPGSYFPPENSGPPEISPKGLPNNTKSEMPDGKKWQVQEGEWVEETPGLGGIELPQIDWEGYFWRNGEAFESLEAIPEGAIVQSNEGKGFIKKNGKLVPQ